MATNTITGGGFQYPDGTLLANGYLTLKLSSDAVNGGQIGSGKVYQVPLDSNGNVSGTVHIWPNDGITPTDTYYTVNVYNSNGQLIWGPQYLKVLASPSPFDITAWIPNAVGCSCSIKIFAILSSVPS